MGIPQIELRPIESLIGYARNARTHSPEQIRQLKGSLLEFGWTNAVLADSAGIVAGHGRVMAARELLAERRVLRFPNGAEIPAGMVPVVDCSGWTDAQRRAYILADNKLALNAGWDDELLRLELQDLQAAGFNLDVAGWDEVELAGFFDLGEPEARQVDPDDVPDAPEAPVSRLGDVWVIGEHRVMCGSSLEPAAWDVLMGQDEADLVFTDPPYGVSIGEKNDSIAKAQGRKNKTGSILNDDLQGDELYRFLLQTFRCVTPRMKPGASIYVYHADSMGLAFRAAMQDAGFKIRGCLIWKKNTFSLGRSDHQWIHEPALFSWKEGAAHKWYGGRKQSTFFDIGESTPFQQMEDGRWRVSVGDAVFIVSGDAVVEALPGSVFSEPKPSKSELHPTMKPVALVTRHLKNSARRGDVVVDAFGGSGSTAIAAQTLGMKSRLMELDPKYVDVIVRRLEMFMGCRAAHATTGEAFPREGEQRAGAISLPEPDSHDADVF